MSTPADLYDAILADPENVDLRLRYADAIEATDPDYAELIRGAVRGSNSREILILSGTLRPRIASPIADLVDDWRIRRGFVEQVTMRAADFLTHGAEVWRRAPIRNLVLTDVTDLIPQIAASPLLTRLTGLDLNDNPIGDRGVTDLVASPHLHRLRWLGLARCDIGADGAEALAATPSLPALRYVDFSDNRVAVTPYGVGQDIDGKPMYVERPPLGDDLDARYGPLAWLNPDWAWHLSVSYYDV
jgi:uncharacterized protein (TIGR02996 family)